METSNERREERESGSTAARTLDGGAGGMMRWHWGRNDGQTIRRVVVGLMNVEKRLL